jgi:thiamine pyrophosphate-dependent acetolactate synthase large subunit-like protein
VRVFEALAERIAELGVQHVFTFMSEDVAPLLLELTDRGLEVFHTRHEHIAIGMADGYSRAGGSLGLAIVGKGPGVTNSLNALVTAKKARSRVLVLAGETDDVDRLAKASNLRHKKYVDQPRLHSAVDVPHCDLASPESAVADFERCFDAVRSDRGVITVNVPTELLVADAGNAQATIDLASRRPGDIAESDVAGIVDRIKASERPLILAGRGAVRADAQVALRRLAELSGALLATTVMANGLFARDEFSVGVAGTFSSARMAALIKRSDLVLAFGSSLDHHVTHSGHVFGDAPIIQVIDDPTAASAYPGAELKVVADAQLAAAAIVAECERATIRQIGFRTSETAQLIEMALQPVPIFENDGATGIDPRWLMQGLDRLLPIERTVVVDSGNHLEFPIVHLRVPDPSGFVWPIEYSSIGCSLGAALGAAIARPDRLTVLCIGDGGLMHMLGDLNTAARYRLRLLVIVSNDLGLGAERHHLRLDGYDATIADYDNPSFEEVALALGLDALTIRSAGDLEAIADRLKGIERPLLLDCHVDPEVAASFYRISHVRMS